MIISSSVLKIAIVLSVSLDELVFEEHERRLDDELLLLFEGVFRLDPSEKHLIKELIEGVMLNMTPNAISNQNPVHSFMAALTPAYQTLLTTLRTRIQQAQTRAALAVSKDFLHLYWLTGRDIVIKQEQEGWGGSVIETTGKRFKSDFSGVQGFSASNLWRMRAFIWLYSEESYIPHNLCEILRSQPYPTISSLFPGAITSPDRKG